MICPKDGHQCSCDMRLAGVEPCKPTMQEIEGLLGEYVGWCIEANEGGLKDSLANDAVDAARAALMAAIRQLSNSTQDGE